MNLDTADTQQPTRVQVAGEQDYWAREYDQVMERWGRAQDALDLAKRKYAKWRWLFWLAATGLVILGIAFRYKAHQ